MPCSSQSTQTETASPNLEVFAQFSVNTSETNYAQAFSNYLDDLFLFAPMKISTQVPNTEVFTTTSLGAQKFQPGTGETAAFSAFATPARYLVFGLVQNKTEGAATQTALVMAYITNGSLGLNTGPGTFSLNEITLGEISAVTVAFFPTASGLPTTTGDILLI